MQTASSAPATEEASRLRRLAEMQRGDGLRDGARGPFPEVSPLDSRAVRAAASPASGWRDLVARAREEVAAQEAMLRAAAGAGEQAGLGSPGAWTDAFGRVHTYLRISLTERCNLRCTYCMPAEGVALSPPSRLLTSAETLQLVGLFARHGVRKVRLTGGEPTVRRDVVELTGAVARVPGVEQVAMTTNGLVLERLLDPLVAAGLTHLNVSLDTLRADRFERLTRRRGHERVVRALDRALDRLGGGGLESVKLNVVVQRGVNDDELAAFAALTRERPLNVRFIEWMPFDGNVWSREIMVPLQEMRERIERAAGAALARIPAARSEVAQNYALPGHAGSVSFVASMTEPFCGGCNRLRLMADGNLKVCLFGQSEVSLRDIMRADGASDQDLEAVVRAALFRKKRMHAGMHALAGMKNRPMVKIGG